MDSRSNVKKKRISKRRAQPSASAQPKRPRATAAALAAERRNATSNFGVGTLLDRRWGKLL